MILPEEMKSVLFLRELGEAYLRQVAAMACLKEYREGAILFREGDVSPVIYFLLTGEVRLVTERLSGEPITIYTAGPGELIGWSPVLGKGPMTATACVSSHCRAAVVEASRVMAMCDQDPRFGMAFLRQVGVFLSDRLTSTRRCLAFSRALQHMSPFALSHEGSD